MVTEVIGRGAKQRLRIHNRQSFTGLEHLVGTWELWSDDVMSASGRLPRHRVEPHKSADVPLPCAVPAGAGDVFLTVRWALRAPAWFAHAGHVVAIDQAVLRSAKPRGPKLPRSTDRRSSPIDDLLVAPVELALWRAPVDNDGFKLMPELDAQRRAGSGGLRDWTKAGIDSRPADSLVEHTVKRSVDEGDGSVTEHHVVVVPDGLQDLPRVGVQFSLPGRFSTLRWFGLGPHENYPDRRSSATVGVWTGAPDAPPYLVPQEFGLRCDCRWLECIDDRGGQRVRIDALLPTALHMSATNYTAADLTAAANQADLVARDQLVVHLDVAHRGLGTASCGPDVLPAYRLPAGRFEFAFRLSLH